MACCGKRAVGPDGMIPDGPYKGVVTLMPNPERVRDLIGIAIEDLDLSEFTVLTEAASGNYLITPVLAAAAGARVYALAATTEYGCAKDMEVSLNHFADWCGVKDRIEVITEKSQMVIEQADIVTNLGPVRPIDQDFIAMMKPGAVVISMHEEWEQRESDIDIAACKARKIPVVYVKENSIFNYCGLLCAKMLFEVDLEIYKNKILVLSGDKFGKTIEKCLRAFAADVKLIPSGPWLPHTKGCDAIVVADLAGDITISEGMNLDIPIIRFVENGRMNKTLGYLGPKPVIELHTEGFRIAAQKLKEKDK